MRCDQISPYLPGYAGGELRPDTTRIVSDHLAGCDSCRAETAIHQRVVASLATIVEREVEAPAFLFESILEGVADRRDRRFIPMLPIPVADVAHAVAEHREQIASAAGTALVAAGAAYALWRALRSSRSSEQPA